MYEKIKSLLSNDIVFYGLLVILVAVTAFGLGRQSVVVPTTAPAVAENQYSSKAGTVETAPSESKTHAILATSSELKVVDSKLVASKNGSRYHYLWCPGARTIKESNQVFFDNVSAARAAGYTPAANCPGLE